MAVVAGLAVVLVSRYACVFPAHFRLVMTAQAVEDGVIIRIRMAIRALVPFSCMTATVYREVLVVVVESRRNPGKLGVAEFAICRILCS